MHSRSALAAAAVAFVHALATCGGDTTVNDTSSASSSGAGASSTSNGGTGGNSSTSGSGGSGAAAGNAGSGGNAGVCNDAPAVTCSSNADCRQFASYCDDAPCACLPLASSDPDPTCGGMQVACFDDPCLGKSPVCLNGRCTTNGGVAGEACLDDLNCAPGLMCCYPCGMPGCSNQCLPPDASCSCPLFP